MADAKLEPEGQVENLTPESITRETIKKMMDSPKFFPQQFKIEKALNNDVTEFDSRKSQLRDKVNEMVAHINETADKNQKRLSALEITQSVAPDTWKLVFGGLTPEEVLKTEISQNPAPGLDVEN